MNNIIVIGRLKYVGDQQEITRLKNIIERHEDKIERLREKGWWGDVLIKPIMRELNMKFPTIRWDSKISPMGFKCRTPMFAYIDGNMAFSVTFVPEDLTKGEISFETGELIDQNKGFDAHGFNIKCEIITDIQQVFDYVEKQIVKYLEK
jgi:hypothetical protein